MEAHGLRRVVPGSRHRAISKLDDLIHAGFRRSGDRHLRARTDRVTCNATTQAKGCRALQFTYTTVGSAKRLSQIDLTIWDPKPGVDGKPTSSAAMTTTAVQKYSYDTDGKLTGAWDPRLGDGTAALKTVYTYQTVGTTHTMLSTITPPGEKPWQLNFDVSAELTSVTRAQDPAVGGSDATWTVDYDLALSGTGLPNLEASTVATWGQPQAPTEATAVFGPDASGTSDMTYADISYFTKEGRTTNTASYGAGAWQVDSTGYDSVGNVVWQLNEGNRNRALEAGGDTAAAANLLTTKSVYNGGGTRIKRVGTSAHRGTRRRHGNVWAPKDVQRVRRRGRRQPRARQANPRRERTSAEPARGATRLPGQHRRIVCLRPAENPVSVRQSRLNRRGRVELGMPTRTSTEISADTWSTELTRFDSEGKTIETRTPQGVSTTDGAGRTQSRRSPPTTQQMALPRSRHARTTPNGPARCARSPRRQPTRPSRLRQPPDMTTCSTPPAPKRRHRR